MPDQSARPLPAGSTAGAAFPPAYSAPRGDETSRCIDVPPAAAGKWCTIVVRVGGGRWAELLPSIVFEDAAQEKVSMQYFLGLAAGHGKAWHTVAYVSASAAVCRLMPLSAIPVAAEVSISFRPITRLEASLRILGRSWQDLPKVARLVVTGKPRRARTLLIQMSSMMHRQTGYELWARCFDAWPSEPPPGTAQASVAALVFQHDPGAAAPLDATLASLDCQGIKLAYAVLTAKQSAAWRQAAAGLSADYIALLQAGEVLPPHAAWLAGAELRRLGDPAIALADQDVVRVDGVREDPTFRPAPNRALMLSGTQTRGVWFVRRDVLLAYPDDGDPGWAECLRLEVWLQWHEAGGRDSRRIAAVLTHRRADAEAAPAAVLAAAVNAHLARTRMPLAAQTGFPLVLRSNAPGTTTVSIVVPSTLRSPLVRRCLHSVLESTAYDRMELVVGVSQPSPLDPMQRQVASDIAGDARARVMHLARPSFNFSEVCNTLAAATSGEMILLLNDDVSVIASNWLQEMVAQLADPAVGIVGAKLLYPDDTVQHGGVIMGLAGLCDHAHRNLPRASAGYDHRALLAQELSAVTAACLLVRRSVFEQVGGLDPSYPSAFNDVDFCLRVREAGYGVVFAPAAELTHHEMQTYGSHYSGDRAPFQAAEIARMRRRWAGVVAEDPFHNPNLELAPGREWHPAFPPRGLRSPPT